MGVYLGTIGQVEIRREAGEQLLVTRLDPNDVNVSRNRFSVDFAFSSLITGDYVSIATLDGSPLKLVSGHQDASLNYFPDWSGYVHVDDVGGLRLYSTFAQSLTGSSIEALPLVQPDTAVDVSFKTDDPQFNLLGQVSNFELTTNRDQVNTDVLGTEFHSYFEAGLISGQGTLTCFWEHTRTNVQSDSASGSEFSSYLARLLLRLNQGSAFEGRFYLYSGANGGDAIYYQAECLVTSFAVTVQTDQLIQTRIEFVATGPITLRQGFAPGALLQENGNKILQEDGNAILLDDPE